MLVPFLLALQVQAQPPNIRLVVTPSSPTVAAGDTLRLRAQTLDASGKPVSGAAVRYMLANGMSFEGEVDSTGLVTAGSTGILPVTVVAIVPGAKPLMQRVEVRMVAGPTARIEVSARPAKLLAGQRTRLSARAFSAAGDERDDEVTWSSTSPGVIRVTPDGALTAVAAGRATLIASAGSASERIAVEVIPNTLASFEVRPATERARQGDVIRFTASARDRNGRAVSGLEPAWSFSPGQGMIDADGAFVGYDPGRYTVTAVLGGRVANALVTIEPRDVRRPAKVVGRLVRSAFSTSEVWLHPNGRHAYLGTAMGGDRLYAIDISNPARPVVTDSIVANMRMVNDIMTTPDGKYLVYTREGADDRKNGIGIASVEDPAHPKTIADFSAGVTAGVHSAFVYQQPKHGTHVYLTNDGTGAMHVIDINDARRPKEVAQWRTARADAGRTLHDIDIQDGLAYLSYWNDGLVVLDVGNGVKGGSPSNPQLVMQHKYDLNALYRDVELSQGPGFIRGTHTAWRHGKYVFVADEVFGAEDAQKLFSDQHARAYGRLQVIDVSDMSKPRSVAWYEPEYGGVHNIWIAGDTLYMGAYNAGFRAFDISGELRGDLRAQAREIAFVNTAAPDGKVPNAAMTWGVVVRDGLAYVNDFNSGLWIVRIEPKSSLTP